MVRLLAILGVLAVFMSSPVLAQDNYPFLTPKDLTQQERYPSEVVLEDGMTYPYYWNFFSTGYFETGYVTGVWGCKNSSYSEIENNVLLGTVGRIVQFEPPAYFYVWYPPYPDRPIYYLNKNDTDALPGLKVLEDEWFSYVSLHSPDATLFMKHEKNHCVHLR